MQAVGVRFLRLSALLLLAGALMPRPAMAQSPRARLPVLSTIAAIRTLSQDEAARGYPVNVRAIVTHVDEHAHATLFIHDGELGQFVAPPADPRTVPAWAELKRGDLVAIEGRTERGGFAPNIRPSAVRRLGAAPMPPAKQFPFAALLTGRHDCDYVEMSGVIQRAWVSSDPKIHTLFVDLAYEDGVVRAGFWDYKADDLTRHVARFATEIRAA